MEFGFECLFLCIIKFICFNTYFELILFWVGLLLALLLVDEFIIITHGDHISWDKRKFKKVINGWYLCTLLYSRICLTCITFINSCKFVGCVHNRIKKKSINCVLKRIVLAFKIIIIINSSRI